VGGAKHKVKAAEKESANGTASDPIK